MCKPEHLYYQFMKKRCEKTCEFCYQPPEIEPCKDKHRHCKAWVTSPQYKKRDMCETNRFVKRNCKLSCKTCTTLTHGNWGAWGEFNNCEYTEARRIEVPWEGYDVCYKEDNTNTQQVRTRKCDSPPAKDGGADCVGKGKEALPCPEMCTMCKTADIPDKTCKKWAGEGKCELKTYVTVMKDHCSPACNFCTETPAPPTPAPKPPTEVIDCGVAITDGKYIVGGQDAKRGEAPWQAGIYEIVNPKTEKHQFNCGGTLVKNDLVITAAHCVSHFYPKNIIVYLGDHRRDEKGRTKSAVYRREVKVSEIAVHPNWNPNTLANDIAVLKLKVKVAYNNYIRPACLPSSEKDITVAEGKKCKLTGWGRTEVGSKGKMANVLQKAIMPVIDTEKCKQLNEQQTPDVITDGMMCGGPDPSKGVSACHGDSGGPLVCQNEDNKHVLHGVASWGDPKCDANERYSVFTRVSRYIKWIHNWM